MMKISVSHLITFLKFKVHLKKVFGEHFLVNIPKLSTLIGKEENGGS